ncbi:MAG: hypothetical protein OEY78_06885 [Gammaproteobacteria bacterium]|nr:hypothetical protein [Gammaproteobacteria bacterium]
MGKRILLITALTILTANIVHAEKLATVLKGKITASNLSGLEVAIKESDGSILDMTDVSSSGTFKLDISVMDMSSLVEVKKLIIEVKDKSGTKKNYFVKKYISDFNDTVSLEPIIFK